VSHQHAAGVARQALGRSSWNARTVLEDGLTWRIRVRQDFGIDVDDYLVALARGARVDAVVEGRLREQRERVRLLLNHRRRVGVRLVLAPLLIQRLARGGQRLHEQRADFRCQPPTENDGAVCIGIHVQRPARVLQDGLAGLGLPVHPAPAADNQSDVLCRAGAPHRDQPLLGFGRGHASQLPDLGVRQLPAGERLGQQRQRAERARHSHVLARGAGGEPHPPAQPGGARAEAGIPTQPDVELADQVEEASRRGVEVRRQLGDLVAQPVQLRGMLSAINIGIDGGKHDRIVRRPRCLGDIRHRVSVLLMRSSIGDATVNALNAHVDRPRRANASQRPARACCSALPPTSRRHVIRDVSIKEWMRASLVRATGHLHETPSARPRASAIGCWFVDDAGMQAERDDAIVAHLPDSSLRVHVPPACFTGHGLPSRQRRRSLIMRRLAPCRRQSRRRGWVPQCAYSTTLGGMPIATSPGP
jgi:hypothetical protein